MIVTDSIIEKTVKYVKQALKDAEGGHDWWHIHRVWNLAKHIAQNELNLDAKQFNESLLIVELGALLHDIADSKFHQGDETIGPQIASDFLKSLQLSHNLISEDIVREVVTIIRNVSYRGGQSQLTNKSFELCIIQDADRLDAMGAIGIARTFNYGGFKNREIYNPNIKPALNQTKEQYKQNTAPSINHFYEKLLLLKDQMNTSTGKKMAEKRHRFMEEYLNTFFKEWDFSAS